MVVLTEQQFNAISEVISYTYEQQCIRPSDVKKLERFRQDMERVCQVSLNCCLEIFGSTKNGFGTRNSDVDLCLHLDPYSPVTRHFVSCRNAGTAIRSIPYSAAILLGLAYDLRRMWDFKKLTAILTARVPVLKIACGSSFNDLQADLTICNEVAVWNTKLLRSYGSLDKRVRPLGIGLKTWVKCCNIIGASEGWLSSYAYIIMLIHFLQRTEKPVLPFLQQVSLPSKPKRPMMIGEWDVYFYNPSEMVWLAPNAQNLGELWLEFFSYYAWKFDFKNEVVQIRHPRTVTKKRKGWECSSFAIEDPFVLSHNLAATVDAEALSHIKETFALTYYHFFRGHFLRCDKELDISHAKCLYRKFDITPDLLFKTCCSLCGKASHIVEECPTLSSSSLERFDTRSVLADRKEPSTLCLEGERNYSHDSGMFSLASDSDTLFSDESRSVVNSDETSSDGQEVFDCVSDCGETIDEGFEAFESLSSANTTCVRKLKNNSYIFDPNMVFMVRSRSSNNLTSDSKEVALLPYRPYNEPKHNSSFEERSQAGGLQGKLEENPYLQPGSSGEVLFAESFRATTDEKQSEDLLVVHCGNKTVVAPRKMQEGYFGPCLFSCLTYDLFYQAGQRSWIDRFFFSFFPVSFLKRLFISLTEALRKPN